MRAEARRLREKFGVDRVYAYGSSAGGTLAALLSGDSLVSAAVAKAPVSDLAHLGPGRLEKYGPELLGTTSASTTPTANGSRRSAAQQRAPLLVIQGRADHVVPPSMNEAFAATLSVG